MEGFLHIYENEISIRGIKRNYEFLHISDTHLCISDDLSEKDEAEWADNKENYWKTAKKEFAELGGEYFGPEHQISTKDAFEKLLAYAALTHPDLLILSGDNLEGMHPAGERFLRKSLDSYIGKYVIVPGNHEDKCLEGLWDGRPRLVSFEDFQVLVVDDRLKTVDDETLDTVEKISRGNVPTVIVTHIPICTSYNREEMNRFDSYFYIDENSDDENAKKFVSLICESDVFVGVLCGHVHTFSRSELRKGKIQICSSQGMIGAVDKVIIRP